MESATAADLLGRRLDRLRQRGSAAHASGSAAGRRQGGRQRAAELARELGGGVLETSHGPVAMVESQHDVALDCSALHELPFAGLSDGPLVCLDLETTGLGTGSGTLAFLVGLGRWQGGRLQVTQLVLADHADERALLAAVHAALGRGACLVTYNGRSFDWPLLVTRFRLQRWDPPIPVGHFDLLPAARQLWRHRLADARLATVEAGVCGVARSGDLPGALVPERFFAYLRSRRAGLLREVLQHNRQDIVSLGLLLRVLATQLARDTGRTMAHPGDLLGLARAYWRRGRLEEALACLDTALDSSSWRHGLEGGAALYRRLATQRALVLGRLGRRADALAAWLALAERGGPGAALAWIRVASHREHHEGDIAAALAACERAQAVCFRARAWGQPLVAAESDLQNRRARLERRLRRLSGASAARPVAVAWASRQRPAYSGQVG